MLKNSPLRKMSKAKAIENRKYVKLKNEALGKWPTCEFPDCIRIATQVHHQRGRIGSMLCDKRYWILLCQFHHTWIHEHSKTARAMGLLK